MTSVTHKDHFGVVCLVLDEFKVIWPVPSVSPLTLSLVSPENIPCTVAPGTRFPPVSVMLTVADAR
ncbi:MAG: hypothetical protein HGB11_08470 [Chlorobiales bacterium]|nr:hypothetical protein [Chlorobiales bacterium]